MMIVMVKLIFVILVMTMMTWMMVIFIMIIDNDMIIVMMMITYMIIVMVGGHPIGIIIWSDVLRNNCCYNTQCYYKPFPITLFSYPFFVDMSLECCAHNIMSKLKAVVQRIGRTSRTRSNGAIFYRWPSVTFTFLAQIIRWNACIPKYEFILYHTC